jgi:hypothetical protein
MVWNSTWPDGTKSVKQNTTPGQENTTYTKTTQNNDHFWDFGAAEDGYHRKLSMESYADIEVGSPTDAPIPAGMDAVHYLKSANGRIQGHYRNANGIYQYVPSFLSGTVSVTSTSTYATVVAVPDDCYGHIYLFTTTSADDGQMGFFKADGGVVQSYSLATTFASSSTAGFNLKLGNGAQASALNIRVRRADGPSATYQYRITYWAT